MSGTRQQLNIALQSTKATLLVKTNTADTKIFIDEDFKGMNKWQGKLTPGTYLVEARKDGYRTFSTSVTLAKQQTDTITLPILQPAVRQRIRKLSQDAKSKVETMLPSPAS